MTEILTGLAGHPLITLLTALLMLAGLFAGLHFTFANIRKTNAEAFKSLWEHIDKQDTKIADLQNAADVASGIMKRLQNRIATLERILRENNIPFPAEDGSITEPLPKVKRPGGGSGIFGISL